MVLMVICGILALTGLVAIVAWGGRDLTAPAAPAETAEPAAETAEPAAETAEPAAETAETAAETAETAAPAAAAPPLRQRAARTLRRYAWWATMITVVGAASGILMAGAGGRLVMRVLAVTSPAAEGRITEAQARVGDITLDGTFALLMFGALPGAFLSAILYVLIHRWLPRGRWGGVVFGALLLALLATTLDPLRAGNFDFDVVGPGWLAILLFSTLVIMHGMLVAAIAGWYSQRLPLFTARRWPAYSPLLAAVVYVPLGLVLAAGAVVALLGSLLAPAAARRWSSPPMIRTGRIALVILVAVAVPGFAGSVASIIGR